MRGFKQFSFRDKWNIFPFFFKKRVLNFKRPKWKQIKKKIFYSIKQYTLYRKRLISIRFCSFLNTLNELKKEVTNKKYITKDSFKFTFLKFLNFFKKILISKKFIKLKRRLKYKLNFYFQKSFYLKYKYFQKCFKLFFFNYSTLKMQSKQHIRSRFFFKIKLLSKSSVLKYYYGCFPLKFFKKCNIANSYQKSLVNTFITPELRLDILLWRLKFYRSPYLAKFAFCNERISLNFFDLVPAKKYKYKYFLKRGDIVSLKNYKYNYRDNLNAFVSCFYLPSFIELDYYTNTLILLKDINLNLQDLNSILKEPLNFYKFRDSLI